MFEVEALVFFSFFPLLFLLLFLRRDTRAESWERRLTDDAFLFLLSSVLVLPTSHNGERSPLLSIDEGIFVCSSVSSCS